MPLSPTPRSATPRPRDGRKQYGRAVVCFRCILRRDEHHGISHGELPEERPVPLGLIRMSIPARV